MEYIDEIAKTVCVKDKADNVIESQEFYLSKFPAVVGRKIMMKYSTTMVDINANYDANEEVMKLIMKYVRVALPDGRKIALETQGLIDNHVKSAEMLAALEQEMLAYNFSFFRDGEA